MQQYSHPVAQRDPSIPPSVGHRLRIVVTGASGNVGLGVLRALVSDMPEAELVGVCRRPPLQSATFGTVEWHAVDLSSPDAEQLLAPAMRAADVVVHLALAVQPVRDASYLFKVNVLGSQAVFGAAQSAGVKYLVHASSLSVYTPRCGQPVKETWSTSGQPRSTYSRNKVRIEQMLDRVAHECPELAVARIRPTVVVQREAAWLIRKLYLGAMIPRSVIKALRAGALPVLPLPAGLQLQFVHADDVGDVVVRLIERRAVGVFNVAADTLNSPAIAALIKARPVAVNATLMRWVVLLLSRMHLIAVTPGWYDVATDSPILDTSRAHDELGWTPTWSSTASARELIDGLSDGVDGPTPATGSSTPRRVDGAHVLQWAHDGTLVLWGLLALIRAVGRRRAGVLDAAVIAANLVAGTPMALERLRARRRDAIALLAPVGVVSALVSYPSGGLVSVGCVGALGALAAAERRRTDGASQ